jgi:antitoxin component YwqK of YwqJK toxin-antitoxin module
MSFVNMIPPPYTREVTGRCQGKLKNGQFDGQWKFYRNNFLSSETSFKDGIFNGIRKVYFRDGRLGTN